MNKKQLDTMKFEMNVLKSSLNQKNNMIYSLLLQVDDLKNERDKFITENELLKHQLREYQQISQSQEQQTTNDSTLKSIFDYFQKKEVKPQNQQQEKNINLDDLENQKFLLINELCNQIADLNTKLQEQQETITNQQFQINQKENQYFVVNKELLSIKKQSYDHIQTAAKPVKDFQINLSQIPEDAEQDQVQSKYSSEHSEHNKDIKYKQNFQKMKEKSRNFFQNINKVQLKQAPVDDKNYQSDDNYNINRLSVILENSLEDLSPYKNK